jgi:hypothetical protein
MMHGHEKSDPVVVAAKFPNKTGGGNGAKDGAEENASQQRMYRTLRRGKHVTDAGARTVGRKVAPSLS